MNPRNAMAGGEVLASAALRAPLVAVPPKVGHPRAPDEPDEGVMHAVTMGDLIRRWPDGPVISACGVDGLKLVHGGDRISVEWPPRVRSLPDGWTRCRECHVLTGRKRPRSEWK